MGKEYTLAGAEDRKREAQCEKGWAFQRGEKPHN
jgi:hypothetical protein